MYCAKNPDVFYMGTSKQVKTMSDVKQDVKNGLESIHSRLGRVIDKHVNYMEIDLPVNLASEIDEIIISLKGIADDLRGKNG